MATNSRRTQRHKCDDCALAHWDTKPINRAHDGSYIGLRCPHQQWLIIRGTKACDKFKERR